MQAKVSRCFQLLVAQGTNRVAMYPLEKQDICRVDPFLNEKPCKETMLAFAFQIARLLDVQNLPANWMLYADCDEYTPLAVHFQAISSGKSEKWTS